jgi:hypothetical protein
MASLVTSGLVPDSTFITVAPKSAKYLPPAGPVAATVDSNTFRPAKGSLSFMSDSSFN